MADFTQWYNLDKYENADKPNLLDQYNSSMEKIDSAMKQIQDEINISGNLIDRVSSLENNVNDINETDANQNSQIENLKKPNYKYYNGKNIVFIGDSFTIGVGCSDYDTTKSKRFSSLICANLGTTEYNFGVGSTGFKATGEGAGHNDPFLTQVNTAASTMTATEKANTAAVIIAGGINDKNGNYTYTEMQAASRQTVNAAATAFPNATILLVPMLYKGFEFTAKAQEYYYAIITGGRNTRKCKIVEGAYTWNWGNSNRFNSDKIHPTDVGYSVIADNIIGALVYGNLECWEDHIYTVSYPSGGTIQAGEGSNNTVALIKGIVYIKPCVIKSTSAISTNTRVIELPKCITPETYVSYNATNSSNVLYGVATLTSNTAYVLLNPYNASVDANAGIYLSCVSYPVYGYNYA